MRVLALGPGCSTGLARTNVLSRSCASLECVLDTAGLQLADLPEVLLDQAHGHAALPYRGCDPADDAAYQSRTPDFWTPGERRRPSHVSYKLGRQGNLGDAGQRA
jgi:hypothetical protein